MRFFLPNNSDTNYTSYNVNNSGDSWSNDDEDISSQRDMIGAIIRASFSRYLLLLYSLTRIQSDYVFSLMPTVKVLLITCSSFPLPLLLLQ